jgi:hypothetical protein
VAAQQERSGAVLSIDGGRAIAHISQEKRMTQESGVFIGLGIALGAGIGAAMDNIALGVAIGLVLGVGLSASRQRRSK